jgi:hypothetical protein
VHVDGFDQVVDSEVGEAITPPPRSIKKLVRRRTKGFLSVELIYRTLLEARSGPRRLVFLLGSGLFCGMDPTRFRMRYLVGIVVAAVVTAAALRHVVHIYVSLEEIRAVALTAAGVGILVAILLLRRRKRQP